MPKRSGRTTDANAHFALPVSFFTVNTAAEQGKCIRVKIINDIAVEIPQPFWKRMLPNAAVDEYSTMPDE